MAPEIESQRLDKWLWHARFFKSRSLASEFCEGKGVRIGGQPVRKAHYQLKRGDVLTFACDIRDGRHIVRVLRVLGFSPRRLGAPLARELYEDLDPPTPRASPETAGTNDDQGSGERDPGSGRPTKADRRAMQRFKGADG